jgi:hypothetical protein
MPIKRFPFIIVAMTALWCVACTSNGDSAKTASLNDASSGTTAKSISLDDAIREAAANIDSQLETGVKIALLNFTSPSERFSKYVLEELSGYLVNSGKLVVIDNKELALIRQEEKLQLSGEVSDASAQSVGRKLGAKMIVSGSLGSMPQTIVSGSNRSMREVYRLRIKTIWVESAAIAAQSATDIHKDDGKVKILLDGAYVVDEFHRAANAKQPPAYKIGDTGPAGGIIFFDKCAFESGWRYLEAAPYDFKNVLWGMAVMYGTKTDIGSGKWNTELIVKELKRLGQSGDAAQLCAALDVGGYKDWFLPSKDELNLMYINLKKKGLGGFSDSSYWSSSESHPHSAWGQMFSVRDFGYQYSNYNKFMELSVRAVRAF